MLTLPSGGGGTFTNSLRVDHTNNAGSDILVRLGNVNNSGTNSAHLFLANGFYVSPTAVDGTGAAAKNSYRWHNRGKTWNSCRFGRQCWSYNWTCKLFN